jgi:myo-inositol-1(or 4)-monophosphatase
MQEYLKVAIKAAKEAGKVALKRASELDISTKETKFDFVTNADTEAEHAIMEILSKEFPEIGFLAEESGSIKRGSKLLWVIDPIDGTNNYINGVPFFCTSIALAKNDEPILGVIYEPNRDELFYAAKGSGAFLNGKKITVSNRASLDKALVVLSFSSARKAQELSSFGYFGFADLYKNTRAVRKFGAAALELAYVASGRVDAFLHRNIKPWDGAAGTAIIQEAGGKVTNSFAKPWRIHDRFILATNGLLHKELCALLKL